MAGTVRRATVADAPALGAMMADFGAEFGEREPSAELATERFGELLGGDDDLALVALAPDPAGFAFLRVRSSVYSRAREAYLQELYVRPDRRGEGHGELLLRASLDLARELGCDRIELGTAVGDRAARALYEKLGFTNYEGREGRADSRMLFYEREL